MCYDGVPGLWPLPSDSTGAYADQEVKVKQRHKQRDDDKGWSWEAIQVNAAKLWYVSNHRHLLKIIYIV